MSSLMETQLVIVLQVYLQEFVGFLYFCSCIDNSHHFFYCSQSHVSNVCMTANCQKLLHRLWMHVPKNKLQSKKKSIKGNCNTEFYHWDFLIFFLKYWVSTEADIIRMYLYATNQKELMEIKVLPHIICSAKMHFNPNCIPALITPQSLP